MTQKKTAIRPSLRLSKNIVFDSLSIGTTLPIELVVSKKRAKLAFLMPLKVNFGIAAREDPLEDTERLNDARCPHY